LFCIVVGCGRVGAELAFGLFRKGHQVTIIDQVGASFQHLNPAYRGRTIEAEVLNQDVLRRAGAEQADALAAVTNSDATNAVVAHIARAVFKVPNVVARNYDPRWRPLHEAMGLHVVSSTAWGAQRIEEILHADPCRSVFTAGNGEVEVYELAVTPAWHGKALRDFLRSTEGVAVALTRGGKAALPAPDTPLQTGDILHVGARPVDIGALRQRLVGTKEG
jgi:trk system potassium uptake protein TrkA